MTSKLCFSYATLTTAGAWARHAQRLRRELPSGLGEGRLYALFAPQFGLASDQLVVMTCWDDPEGVGPRVEKALRAIEGVEKVEQHMVVPTARPRTSEPPIRKGLYVHRWFDLEPRHVDEVVELSAVAWETFERTFEVEVIGFFRTLGHGSPRRDAAHAPELVPEPGRLGGVPQFRLGSGSPGIASCAGPR